jgi:hypothetical protein
VGRYKKMIKELGDYCMPGRERYLGLSVTGDVTDEQYILFSSAKKICAK